jgi:hypothetical protein
VFGPSEDRAGGEVRRLQLVEFERFQGFPRRLEVPLQAEGRVYGTPPEDILFHEVGAVDAIVDITGTCIGFARLGVEAVHCSALPIGGGFVDRAPMGASRFPPPAPPGSCAACPSSIPGAAGAGDERPSSPHWPDRPEACRP